LGIINILGGIASFLGAEADWAGAILGLPLNPLLSPLLLPPSSLYDLLAFACTCIVLRCVNGVFVKSKETYYDRKRDLLDPVSVNGVFVKSKETYYDSKRDLLDPVSVNGVFVKSKETYYDSKRDLLDPVSVNGVFVGLAKTVSPTIKLKDPYYKRPSMQVCK